MDEIKRHGPLEARLWVQHNSKHVITPTIISMLAENDDLRARLAALTDAIGNIERLFSGDPDTSCRTTWRRTYTTTDSDMLISRPPVECVEVPLDDLRAVLADAAAAVTTPNNTPPPTCPQCGSDEDPERTMGGHWTCYDPWHQ